jgi:hypothetical protein
MHVGSLKIVYTNFLHEERRWIISSIWPELYHTDFFDLGQHTIRPSQAPSSKVKAQTKFYKNIYTLQQQQH